MSYNILLTIFATLISAIIGSVATVWYQEKQKNIYNEKLRGIAIKAISIFRKYSGKSYDRARGEFNASLNITEKRIILVLLHKLGIPIDSGIQSAFDISNVDFLKSIVINKDDLENIEQQIRCGNCDRLFFIDPDEYFTKNSTKLYRRNLALKFVKEMFSKSRINLTTNSIDYDEPFLKHFSVGDLNAILVFKEKIQVIHFFREGSDNSCPMEDKVQELIREINIGIWDNYLEWSYETYNNLKVQSNLASNLMNNMSMHVDQQ